MFKKLFTFSHLLLLSCATLGIGSLSSCSSGADSEEQQFAGYMTLADFASGRNAFFIRNAYFRFFFVRSSGDGTVADSQSSNEVVVTGEIDVDGELFPATMIYTTNEHATPDGLPSVATLEISLQDSADTTDTDLIEAVFRDVGDGAGTTQITGEPIVFSFNFNQGLGTLECTISTEFTYIGDDGNWYIGTDSSEESQIISVGVLPSTVTPD